MSVPTAPIIRNAPRASPNTLEYYWYTPANDGGSPILGYQFVLNPGSITCNTPVGPINYYKITGLTNAQLYDTTIAASTVNGYGTIASFRPFQPGSKPPLGPSTTVVTISGTSSATLSWTPPRNYPPDPDATIFWYTITSTSTNPADPVHRISADGLTQSNYFIPGLNPDSQYTFRISAVNCPGYSPKVSTTLVFRGTVTGGTVTTSGIYTIHTFTTNTTCVVTLGNITVDILVVAGGGGGGGGGAAAGGGAGGVVFKSSFLLTPGNYSVTIGGGGGGGSGNTAKGSTGGNSVFGSLTALGGGGGAADKNINGDSGGSGGGGAGESGRGGVGGAAQQPGSPSGGFGNAGANGQDSSPNYGGGGGGGAGAAGSMGTGTTGGNGGIGYQTNISGTNTYYGGGGGGGALGGTGGGGGAGGGGNGTSSGNGNNATANTGGGGGGAGSGNGGGGGSGIIILRYVT
jgi:hypothetical protein